MYIRSYRKSPLREEKTILETVYRKLLYIPGHNKYHFTLLEDFYFNQSTHIYTIKVIIPSIYNNLNFFLHNLKIANQVLLNYQKH